MDQALKDRAQRYVESVTVEYLPGEVKNLWQHPAPVYHPTKDYAASNDKVISRESPAIFRRVRKEWMIVSVMLIVAAVLLYLLSKNEFGFTQLVILAVLLLIVLPLLLDNKPIISISPEGIWLYKDDNEIHWENVVLTYIKEVREETVSYFFIVHYYDAKADAFTRIETALQGLAEPVLLSATIEAFRRDTQHE